MEVLHGVSCGGRLLCGNGANRGDHSSVDRATLVEENAEYLLY